MSAREKCLEHVQKYRNLANSADNSVDRETWLQLAQSWLLLSDFEAAALRALAAASDEMTALKRQMASAH